MFRVTSSLHQRSSTGDDRLVVTQRGNSVWFCIADGAGGTGSGSLASDYITQVFTELSAIPEFSHPDDFESFLRKLDLELACEKTGGETTAVLGVVNSDVVIGASVGDSEAWLMSSEYDLEITSHQHLKPLLGSGKAVPIGFGPIPLVKSLLVASDGLFKYADLSSLRAKLDDTAEASGLSRLAALPNGAYQDDVAVILIERTS